MRGILSFFCALVLLGCAGNGEDMGGEGGSVGEQVGEVGGGGEQMVVPMLPWVVCGGYVQREVVVGGEVYVLEEPIDCEEHIKPGDDVMGGWNSVVGPVVR